jgi:hypothetical protein
VQTLSDKMLLAIGRMTVAVGELEGLLAWLGGSPGETRPDAVLELARVAARGEAQRVALVEAAATQLARARIAVRTLNADFDDITAFLLRVRDDLAQPVEG